MANNVILGDGIIGSELKRQTGWESVTRRHDGFDVRIPFLYNRYLSGFDCIINCTGFIKDNSDKQNNLELNFKAVVDLVNYCNQHGKKYVHIGSEVVYTGSVHCAKESDVPVHARNWYGYAKLLADGYVQEYCKDYLLFRTALRVKPFPYKIAYPKIGNFGYVDVIVGLFIELIKGGATGVYNVGLPLRTMLDHARETVPDIELDNNHELLDVSMDLSKMDSFRTKAGNA